MHKYFAVGAFAISTPFSAACAQQKVASDADIGAAVSACIAAVSPVGIDEAKLSEAGFARGKIEATGRTVETKLGFYGKAENPAIVMTMAEPNPACTVVARIRSVSSFPAMVESISQVLQSKPVQQKADEITWRRGAAFIQLAATGSREKPSIRTVVMAMQEEKK